MLVEDTEGQTKTTMDEITGIAKLMRFKKKALQKTSAVLKNHLRWFYITLHSLKFNMTFLY